MQSVRSQHGYGMTLSACLWLGLFPLLGGTYARITYSKWIIMLILTGVTLLCFLFDLIRDHFLNKEPIRKLSIRNAIPLIVAAVLFLWIVITCLCSFFDPDIWWFGKGTRYEGLASQLCYFFLFICFFFSRVHLKPVLLSASGGVAVFFVIVLLQRSGGNPLMLYPGGRSYAQNPEFQGTIGNIDMDTGYLLLLTGLFLGELINSIRFSRSGAQNSCKQPAFLTKSFFILHSSFFIALLLTLYLIITMDVQFGIFSLGILFLVTLLRFIPKRYRLILLILLIIVVLLTVWFWPWYGGGLWEMHEILHGRLRLSFGSNRLAVWYYSLLMSKENLLTGGGSGTFRSRFNQFLSDNSLAIPSEQDGRALPDFFDTPHNEYIGKLTDHGLPALILFIVLLFLSVFRRRERMLPVLSPCSAAVLCYAVQAFFSFSVCLVAPVFWILLALSFTEQPESKT